MWKMNFMNCIDKNEIQIEKEKIKNCDTTFII